MYVWSMVKLYDTIIIEMTRQHSLCIIKAGEFRGEAKCAVPTSLLGRIYMT